MINLSNIVNDQVEEYIRNTLKKSPKFLFELENFADENKVPIVHKEVAELLKVLMDLKRPKKILEVGTAIGYSALLFLNQLDYDAEITTIERNPIMIERAKENFEKYDKNKKITLLEGMAEDLLPNLKEEYDMIFLDAAKGQYELFLDLCNERLKSGGMLISDNILYKGMIADDSLVIRRKKTIVKRMRNFLKHLCESDKFNTSIIPIGDGLAISYKL